MAKGLLISYPVLLMGSLDIIPRAIARFLVGKRCVSVFCTWLISLKVVLNIKHLISVWRYAFWFTHSTFEWFRHKLRWIRLFHHSQVLLAFHSMMQTQVCVGSNIQGLDCDVWQWSSLPAWQTLKLAVFETLALRKALCFEEYASCYPEASFIFFGDDGQGDVLFAEMVNQDKRTKVNLTATFIHHVRRRNCVDSSLRSLDLSGKEHLMRPKSISLHLTHVGMAVKVGKVDGLSLMQHHQRHPPNNKIVITLSFLFNPELLSWHGRVISMS